MHPSFDLSPAVSLADPPPSSVLTAAVSWVERTLLGDVATAVAILAVSIVGFMMLGGRINVRHGFTVTLGAFVLFGASAIAGGFRSFLAGQDATTPIATLVAEPADFELPPPTLPPPPATQDPYAGASVPLS